MMDTEDQLAAIQKYVTHLFMDDPNPCLVYHNIKHTTAVVHCCHEMANYYHLQENDRFILLAAAWFHDTGHLIGEMDEHENNSVSIMLGYFKDKAWDPNLIAGIRNCILATKMPTHPKTMLEKIICDADTYHLGTADFKMLDPLVWQELELRLGKPVPCKTEKSIQFLKNHLFFTDFCVQKLSTGKAKNMNYLKSLK